MSRPLPVMNIDLMSVSVCPLGPIVRVTARPPQRLFHLVFESYDGRALVPIPKRSTSPRAASTLHGWNSLKALDPERPIREADIRQLPYFAALARESTSLAPSICLPEG